MGVVVEVRPGRDDPVDEARLHQRNQRAHAESRRRHRPGEAHGDGHVGFEHPPGEELAGLPQPAGVVGQEGLVDQIRGRLAPGDRRRRDALAAQEILRGSRHGWKLVATGCWLLAAGGWQPISRLTALGSRLPAPHQRPEQRSGQRHAGPRRQRRLPAPPIRHPRHRPDRHHAAEVAEQIEHAAGGAGARAGEASS